MKKIFIIFFLINFVFLLFTQDATSDTKSSEKRESTPAINQTSTATNDTKRQKNGWEYFTEGRYTESINALLEEKKYYPERINIYVILGWDYRELKKYEEMEKISLEGLKIKEDDTRIIRNLAEALFFQKKYNDATIYFQKYLSFTYKTNDFYIPTLYYYLGVSLLNTGSLNKADIALSTAKYYQPKNINVLLALAETKEKLKDYETALKMYNEVLTISPGNSKALEAISKINTTNNQVKN